MARSKSITVPQNGTQPAAIPTPIDNMVAGAQNSILTAATVDRGPTSFNLDKALVARFKAQCASRRQSMSSVIEKLMKNYLTYNVD